MSLNLLSHYIEFPNLGWKIHLNETLFSFRLFGTDFSIKWYGMLIAIGFMLAVIYGLKRAKEFDVDSDRMIDVVLVSTLMGFVGARLYYVLFSDSLADYLAHPLSILKIWEGGIGIYGGIIAAFGFGILMCRWRKISALAMCDMASLGFLIGQAVGRWGNFFNQEAFGGNTNLPWAMTGDIIAEGTKGTGYDATLPVHPTFLYESLWCIIGFILLHLLSKKLYKFKGEIFCGYLVWYGLGRFWIEGLRTDSLMIGTMKTSQLVAILTILGGIILFFVLRRRADALPKMLTSEYADTLDMENAEVVESTVDEESATESAEPERLPAEEPTTVQPEEADNGKEETAYGNED